MSGGTVMALCGGVGGAKLALGLTRVLPAEKLAVVVNTGDDFEHLGLSVSPDVDTVLYTLAGIANAATGWGRAEETWRCMTALEALGGEAWFRLGDTDLATHLYRTGRLRAGASPTTVTAELRVRLGVGAEVVPMTDGVVRTELETDRGRLAFQDYFVRHRCEPSVRSVHYVGADRARPSPRFAELLEDGGLRAVVLCPSNPPLSIGPILAVPGVQEALRERRVPVIAVSPIVRGAALKGPAARVLRDLGIPPAASAVARWYEGVVDGLVIDTADAAEAPEVEAAGVRCRVTATIMHTLGDRERLAREVLEFAAVLGSSRP